MSPGFRRFLWYGLVPAGTILFLYPPQIHGYLNPYDEGHWLGLAQGLITGQRPYHDVFFHYGPIFPLVLKALFTFFEPTLTLIRAASWLFNLLGLFCIYAALLQWVHSPGIRLVGLLAFGSVAWTAHVLTIPLAARFGFPFLAVLCLSFDNRKTAHPNMLWAAGLCSALAIWFSQETGLAISAGVVLYMALHPDKAAIWTFLKGWMLGFLPGVCVVGYWGIGAYWTYTVRATAAMVRSNARIFGDQALPGLEAACLILPLVSFAGLALYALVRSLQTGSFRAQHRPWGYAAFGLLSAIPAWSQPDRWHIYFALPSALFLWLYLAEHWGKTRKGVPFVIAIGVLVLTTPYAWATHQKQQRMLQISYTPSIPRIGVTRLPAPQAKGYEVLTTWINQHIPAGETFLFYPYDGCIYFLSDRPSPSFFPVLALAVNPTLAERVVHEIDRPQVNWVIQDTENQSFRQVPIDTFLAPIHQYIVGHFTPQEHIGPFRFWKRTQEATHASTHH